MNFTYACCLLSAYLAYWTVQAVAVADKHGWHFPLLLFGTLAAPAVLGFWIGRGVGKSPSLTNEVPK